MNDGKQDSFYVLSYSIAKNLHFFEHFLEDAEIYFYDSGDLIYQDNEPVNGVFVVMDGSVECFFMENGKKQILFIANQGAILGLTSVISMKKHATAICCKPSTLAFVSVEVLQTWDSDMLLPILQIQAEKLRIFISQIASHSLFCAEERLLHFLLEMSQDNLCFGRKDLPVHLTFSKCKLAEIINVSRKYVTVLLQNLQKKCRISVKGNEIFLYPSDIEKLLSDYSSGQKYPEQK